MPSAVVGSSVCCPKALWPACTVSRLPSWPSSASRPDLEDWEMPSTPTMAAMPMLIPRADSKARTRRLRSPRLPTRSRSRRDSRDPALVSGHDGVSPRILPSRISMRRSMAAATSRSWVITTMVVPSSCSSRSSSRMDAPVAESRLPVGSSAITRAGRPASARAMAVRCCSPPESWLGRWPLRWPSPTRSMAAAASPSPLGDPAAPVEQAVGDVVEHAEPVEQEELLEHEAQPPGPQPRQLFVGHGRGVLPGDADRRRGWAVRGCP